MKDWLRNYRKAEEENKNDLPFEYRELFKKYSENEEMFVHDYGFKGTGDFIAYKDKEDGVKINRLSELEDTPESFKKFKDRDKVQAFVNSVITDGLFLSIDENAQIKNQIKLTVNPHENSASRIVISGGKYSNATIIIENISNEKLYFGQNIDIISDEGSNIKIISIDDLNSIAAKNYMILSSGNVSLLEVITNKERTRERISVDLMDHAEINIKQALIGRNESYFDIETEINHKEQNTKSNVVYKAVLNDSSKAVYKGVILQGKDSYNSYAYLAESSLLLNKNAKSISVPSLEIENNELKAYHSASSEPINKNYIFYLMSRGLDENSASKMIVYGFLSQAFNEREIDPEILNDVILKRLE